MPRCRAGKILSKDLGGAMEYLDMRPSPAVAARLAAKVLATLARTPKLTLNRMYACMHGRRERAHPS